MLAISSLIGFPVAIINIKFYESKELRHILYPLILRTSILVGLSIILIPYFGIWGVCFSLIFSKLFRLFNTITIFKRHENVKYSDLVPRISDFKTIWGGF